MATKDPARRDQRYCPRCGAIGILRLDQDADVLGEIQGPVMICPVCEEEFTATGMKWLGTFDIAEMSDEQLDELADALFERWNRYSIR